MVCVCWSCSWLFVDLQTIPLSVCFCLHPFAFNSLASLCFKPQLFGLFAFSAHVLCLLLYLFYFVTLNLEIFIRSSSHDGTDYILVSSPTQEHPGQCYDSLLRTQHTTDMTLPSWS